MPVARIAEFDTWRPGYAGATVSAFLAGSTVLADLWLNEGLTVPAANPQVLITLVEDDVSYGKFSAPVYVEDAYTLQIDNIDTTGIIRPSLNTLIEQDVSDAVVTPSGAVESSPLADVLARVVYVVDFGEFLATGEVGASSATNTATLDAAIGAAAASGAGRVIAPAGVYDFIDFTLPDSVVLCGAGKTATYLQSTFAGPVVSIGGNGAGLCDITIDGISLPTNSVGVFMVAADETVMERVLLKRFETGFYTRGAEQGRWIDFSVSDCDIGAKLHGDLNSGAGGGGERFQGNLWDGGVVELCATAGVELKRIDAVCGFNAIRNVSFLSNTGTAASVIGARSNTFTDCIWEDNTANLSVADGTPLDTLNTVVDLLIEGGRFAEGTIALNGNLENVLFDRVEFTDVDVTLTNPLHNVLVRDSREDTDVAILGTATAWLRFKTNNNGASFGLTLGNAATKVWAITLVSGQMVTLEARVIGRQRNGVNRAQYWIGNTGRRAVATLAYDTQTGNFTVGNVLTGGTSGATARIVADSDGGVTGTLSIQDIRGVFVDNEILTDGSTGSATCNGSVTEGAVSVATLNAIRTAEETDASWDCAFVANGPEIELRVTGASAQTVEWTCDVAVVTT